MEQYYSIEEISKRLNLSQKTIRRHISSGKLNSFKIGGVYRIKESDIESFIDGNRINNDGQINLFPEMGAVESSNTRRGDDVNWIEINKNWSKNSKNS